MYSAPHSRLTRSRLYEVRPVIQKQRYHKRNYSIIQLIAPSTARHAWAETTTPRYLQAVRVIASLYEVRPVIQKQRYHKRNYSIIQLIAPSTARHAWAETTTPRYLQAVRVIASSV
ncbi:hypothetical protein J6590_018917 [Homalodisca vitripennis]|nr:hypothetical protein J6590_018917 [Homalodisca vitripennis]